MQALLMVFLENVSLLETFQFFPVVSIILSFFYAYCQRHLSNHIPLTDKLKNLCSHLAGL